MIETADDIDSLIASRIAIAVFGTIAATVAGIFVGLATSTEIGGVVGFVGAITAIWAALRALPIVENLGRLQAVPALAILFFLLGGLVPASLGVTVLPGISIDDVPTLVAAGLAAWWLIENRTKAHIPRIVVPMLAMIAWLMIAWLMINPTLKVLLIGPGRWTIYTLMVVVGVAWFRDARLRWWLLGTLIAIATAQSLISIWAYHSNWLIDGYFIGIERFRWYQLLHGEVSGRATGLLGIASNFFGAYTLIPAFASIGVAVYTRQIWLKTAMMATFGVLAYAGILSYTRATLIGLVLAIIGYLVFARPYRLSAVIVVIVTIAILVTPVMTRFQEGNDRFSLIGQSFTTIGDNAVTGVGSGEYLDGDASVTPHNSFLLQASETGVLGGLLLLTSVLVLLGGVWGGPMKRRVGFGTMATAIFAGLGAILVQTMSNNLLHIPPVATQFWLIGTAGVGFAAAANGRWAVALLAPITERKLT